VSPLIRIALLVAALAVPGLATAQSVIGSSVIDGRRISIFDDGTWAFVDSADGDCRPLTEVLAFCGEANGWTATRPPSPEILAQYRYDDRNYSQFVYEALGTDDGMNLGFMRDAVLDNAAAATGGLASDIPVLDVFDTKIGDAPAETMVYLVELNGLKLVFANTIAVTSRHTLQAMTFSVDDTFSDAHRRLHDAFLGDVRFDG
jgi:hypothetical protein